MKILIIGLGPEAKNIRNLSEIMHEIKDFAAKKQIEIEFLAENTKMPEVPDVFILKASLEQEIPKGFIKSEKKKNFFYNLFNQRQSERAKYRQLLRGQHRPAPLVLHR